MLREGERGSRPHPISMGSSVIGLEAFLSGNSV